MAAFAPEPYALHHVDRIVADGFSGNDAFSPALTLTCLDHDGREVELTLFFDRDARAYLASLAASINRIADDHGRLTDAEREVLIADDRLSPVDLMAAE